MAKKSDETNKRRNRKINTDLLVDYGDNDKSPLLTKKVEKKKRSQKSKHRSKSLGVVIIPECDEERSITLEEAYDMSPNNNICTSLTFSMDDDCYMSDITDEDEPVDKTRGPKRERTVKVKRRPKSERHLLGERDSKSVRKKKTKSRSLDPAPRLLMDPAPSLRHPCSSESKNEDGQRSEKPSKRGGTRSTKKTENHDCSVTSDESPGSGSTDPGCLQSTRSLRRPRNSMEKNQSMRSLRRPRTSTEKRLRHKKDRMKSKTERQRRTVIGDEGTSNFHNSINL